VAAPRASRRDAALSARERYSSDIPDLVLGLHAQAVAWQGLHAMARGWAATSNAALAHRAETVALRLRNGIRAAVARSVRPAGNGALFVPMRLLEGEPVHGVLP